MSDCIFEIHQLWQSGFSRVYSNCYCSCWFEPEIIKIGQSSHKMYSNNILNFQEFTTILIAHTKKVWKLIVCTSYIYVCVCVCVYVRACIIDFQTISKQKILRCFSQLKTHWNKCWMLSRAFWRNLLFYSFFLSAFVNIDSVSIIFLTHFVWRFLLFVHGDILWGNNIFLTCIDISSFH